MSCHGTCPVHDLGTNPETTEALQQGLTYFGSYPYDLLPCCPSGQCSQPPVNSMFDSFGRTQLPANAWSEDNDQTTCLAVNPKHLMLQQVQPVIKDQTAVTEPSSGDEEVKQAISGLQDRMERLERNLENFWNEWEEDKEKLFKEVEANMEKLKSWTTEVNQRVSGLAGEPKGHSKSK